MISIAERKDLIGAAQGHQPLVLIRRVRLLNGYTGRIESAALGVRHGGIVSLDADGFDARRIVDADGLYAMPGFIDTPVHAILPFCTDDKHPNDDRGRGRHGHRHALYENMRLKANGQ